MKGYLLRLALGGAILAALVYSGKLTPSAFASLDGADCLALVGVAGVALLSTSLRWFVLVSPLLQRSDSANALATALSSNIYAFISPAGVGVDVARALALRRKGDISPAIAASSSIVDRTLGLWGLLVYSALVGCFAASRDPLLRLSWIAVSAAACIATAVLLVFLNPVMPLPSGVSRLIPEKLRTALALVHLRKHPRTFGMAVLLALLAAAANQALPVLAYSALTEGSVGVEQWFGGALVIIVNSFGLTPGGLGIGEAAGVQLLHATGGAEAILLTRASLALWAAVFLLPNPTVLSWLIPARGESHSS
ncbi:MAG: lysylphosphatidylglycerol synthase transmembrane domain-containing protein [Armatimonadota bacterium]